MNGTEKRSARGSRAQDFRFPRWETPFWYFGGKPNLREVAPDLYVGAEGALLKGSWDTVLCLNYTDRWDPPVWYRDQMRQAPVRVHRFSEFRDGLPIPTETLLLAQTLWEGRKGPVLIHCHWGLSRSASVAAALLRGFLGCSEREALRRVSLPDPEAWDQVDEEGEPFWSRRDTFLSAMMWAEER
jgi:hypothetical protein